MKSSGFSRRIDDLGRLVLPKELRLHYDLNEHDQVEIIPDGDSIILRKYHQSCLFCDSTKALLVHRGKRVCEKCVQILADQINYLKEL